jgi:K+-sensing histidine kinase KdpD
MSYSPNHDPELFRLDWQNRIASGLHQELPCVSNILGAALRLLCEATHAQQGFALLLEKPRRLFVQELGALSELRLPEGEPFWNYQITQGLVAYVEYEQRVVAVRNARVDLRWRHVPVGLLSRGSVVGVPLRAEGRMLGVLGLLHAQVDHFGDETVRLLDSVSGVIGAALRNALHVERLQAGGQPKGVEELRQDLRAMTYHDMRGLLQNVQLGLASLARMTVGDSRAADIAHSASHNTRQMSRLVKNLLDIERLETDHIALQQGEVALPELAESAVELVRPMLDDNDHGLVIEMPLDLPSVMADSDMILRVIVNLIENAAKYTPRGGGIRLGAEVTGDWVTMRVRDTGPGIPTHLKDDIFDKYVRVPHKGTPSGTGLGLAFCRLAVEAHGGHIWVENETKGGAVFSFTLPAVLPVAISQAVGAD